MDRTREAARIIDGLGVRSLLDVGCRDGVLRQHLTKPLAYSGCDVFPVGHARYVGDIATLAIGERFDCVAALDILEHLDDPFAVFDTLVTLSARYTIVSLPNCYDLKSKVKFVIHNRLGGKYTFGVSMPPDRHKWIMSYDEIMSFYRHKAATHRCRLQTTAVVYGPGRFSLHPVAITSVVARALLPSSWTIATLIGVFDKQSAG
jgi:methyltransferase family protein